MKERAEIAAKQRAEVEEVLLGERTVELVDAVEAFHHLGLERALEVEGTAGSEADQEKGQGDDQEERRDRG
jgi:hypothetical protein